MLSTRVSGKPSQMPGETLGLGEVGAGQGDVMKTQRGQRAMQSPGVKVVKSKG